MLTQHEKVPLFIYPWFCTLKKFLVHNKMMMFLTLSVPLVQQSQVKMAKYLKT